MNKSNHYRVLAAGFAGILFFGAAFITIGSILPALSSKFSLGTAGSSILTGLLPLGVLIGSLVFGPVVDRFGYKFLLIFASILTIIGLELMVLANDLNIVRLAILVMGTGGGILNGETSALVSDISDDKNRSTNLSILGIFYCVGAILIPLLFKIFPLEGSFVYVVSIISALMVISIIYYFTVKFPQPKVKQGFPLLKAVKMASDSTLLLLSFALFFQSALESLSQNWIPTYLTEHNGMASGDAMTALSVLVVGILAGRIVLSIILEKIPSLSVLSAGMALAAMGITLLSLFPYFIAALAGTFLLGFGFASTFPVVLGQIGNKFKELSGTAFSFALSLALLGSTLLNLLIGVYGLSSFPIITILCTLFIISLFMINSIISKK